MILNIFQQRRIYDIFNGTLNNILSKLKQNTQELSTQVNSGNWSAWNLIQGTQEGRNLRHSDDSNPIARSMQTGIENDEHRIKHRSLFQNLGKTLDRIIFRTP